MSASAAVAANDHLETFVYDDDIVRKFTIATVVWGIVGMLVGVIIALELVLPRSTSIRHARVPRSAWLTFGRLRPLHTNAAIFAFAGNAIFAGDLLLDAAAAARRGCSATC